MKNDEAIVRVIEVLGNIPADYGSPFKETDAYATKVFIDVMNALDGLLKNNVIKEESIKDAVSKLYSHYDSSEAKYYAIRDIERKLSFQLDWLIEDNNRDVLNKLDGVLNILPKIDNCTELAGKQAAFSELVSAVNYVVRNNMIEGKPARYLINKIEYMKQFRGNIPEKDLLEISHIINGVKDGFSEQHGPGRSEYFERCVLARQGLTDCLGVIHEAIGRITRSQNRDDFVQGADAEFRICKMSIESLLFQNEKGFTPSMKQDYNNLFNGDIGPGEGLVGLNQLSMIIGKHLAEIHADIQQKKNEYTKGLVLNAEMAKDDFSRATKVLPGIIGQKITWRRNAFTPMGTGLGGLGRGADGRGEIV